MPAAAGRENIQHMTGHDRPLDIYTHKAYMLRLGRDLNPKRVRCGLFLSIGNYTLRRPVARSWSRKRRIIKFVSGIF